MIDNIDKEFQEIFRAFKLEYENFDYDINITTENIVITLNYINKYSNSYKLLSNRPVYKVKSYIKYLAKRDLYRLLSSVTGLELPYGSLTGIRPTKLYYDMLNENKDPKETLVQEYNVSSDKANLIGRVVDSQIGIYNRSLDDINLFINIPICPSRCSYCSFISIEINKCRDIIDDYVNLLIKDIDKALYMIKSMNKSIRSIYIGGGTPTVLPYILFAKLMDKIKDIPCEVTVEAGRPDCITYDNLKLMKDSGVSRISINPQTFNSRTLELIGRKHSIDDIYKAYAMARDFGFDINMDLIAMLPQESYEDFVHSINCALELKPDNITIHTLAIKKGSSLKNDNYDNNDAHLADKMVRYADYILDKNNYKPYYMYRQKYMSGNLENVGYTLECKQCIYNIDIMEETHSIMACGAGSISKRVNRTDIQRAAFVKDIGLYIERFDEMMTRREVLFKEDFSNKSCF